MLGENYIVQSPDDGNANLAWIANKKKIISRWVLDVDVPFLMALDIPSFRLEFLNDQLGLLDHCDLDGKMKSDVFEWMKGVLRKFGLNHEMLKPIEHYEVPEHAVDCGNPFRKPAVSLLQTWSDIRTNANLTLEWLNEYTGVDAEIRIWPHHFDTGVYYPFGSEKAIGAGLAIADSLSETPYFYIYGRSADNSIDLSAVPELKSGLWLKKDWQGALLSIEKLASLPDQEKTVLQFLHTSSDFYKGVLGING